MSLDDYKAEARRLHAFLKARPLQASALTAGSYGACLEAIAAVRGARSWNALQAKPPVWPRSQANPYHTEDVPSHVWQKDLSEAETLAQVRTLSDLRPGEVQFLFGRAGVGKGFLNSGEMLGELAKGRFVTVIDALRSNWHFGKQFGLALNLVDLPLRTDGIREPLMVVGVRNEVDTVEDVAVLLPKLEALEARFAPGNVLVVDEMTYVLSAFRTEFPFFVYFLMRARAAGCVIRFIGQTLQEFESLAGVFPADDIRQLKLRPGSLS